MVKTKILLVINKHQTTNTKQQTTNNKQQTPNNKQQTPNNKHQTTNNKQETTNTKQMNILILCTGNSCRSQMAEGYLKTFTSNWNIVSAGTEPSNAVHPNAIKVMKEEGIDLSQNYPKSVNEFLDKEFDFVITVCGGAKESCPMFIGKVKKNIHIGFDDPAEVEGTEEFILSEFVRIRDEIKRDFRKFYDSIT